MDKFFKFSIALAVLIGAGSAFYYFVIFLPEIERQKEERLVREQQRNAKKDERVEQKIERGFITNERRYEQSRQDVVQERDTKQQSYDSCRASARAAYDVNWSQACMAVFNNRQAILHNCIEAARQIRNNNELSRNQESACNSRFGNFAYSPQCALPQAQAEAINRQSQANQNRCLSEARLNLK